MDKAKQQIELAGRGSGRTTAAMKYAPRGAVYIWVNQHLDYPRELAHKLGRDDLVIVGPDWLTDNCWRGREYPGAVRDHAVEFTLRQWDTYAALQAYLRLRRGSKSLL